MNPSRRRLITTLKLIKEQQEAEAVSAEPVVAEPVVVEEASEPVQDTSSQPEVSTEIVEPAPVKRTKKSAVTP
jgi:hypothetical protein